MTITKQDVRSVLELVAGLGFLVGMVLFLGVIVIHNFITPLRAAWGTTPLAIMIACWVALIVTTGIPRKPPDLQQDVENTFAALRSNSEAAVKLVARLQDEIKGRQEAFSRLEDELRELSAQRSLLGLTPEQQAGLESLVKKQPTVWEIWTSREFLYGKLVLSAFFFGLGLIVTRFLPK